MWSSALKCSQGLYPGSVPYLLHDLILLNLTFPSCKMGIIVLSISSAGFNELTQEHCLAQGSAHGSILIISARNHSFSEYF